MALLKLIKTVFVFGSNLAGRHGKGAALFAAENHGARRGIGVGMAGNSYAIPTKGHSLEILPLEVIEPHVAAFLVYAASRPEWTFNVTRIGCGLARFKDWQIAPMFKGAPVNCNLPKEWEEFV